MTNSTSIWSELDLILDDPKNFYQTIMSRSDPRVKNWLWMQSPFPTLSLILLYLLFVRYGPRFMKDRPAFEMKPVLFVFNFAIVVLYAYLTYEYISGMRAARYNAICQPIVYSNDPNELRLARALWWYYFSKFIEFIDTVFFILRKKNKQVTFLHVYHHASMFFLWWIGIKWVAGGQSVMGALINSIVHVVMYSYYALSCLGPGVQKYLWWKKHITHLQLLQFTLAIIHAVHSLYVDCNFPKWMHYCLIGYAISFIILFTNFYIHAYIRRVGKSKEGTASGTTQMANGVHKTVPGANQELRGTVNSSDNKKKN